MAKVLLHICCGPCAIYPLQVLREQGHTVMGYFYNPNIQPYTEYVKRKEALEKLAGRTDLKVIYDEKYDMVNFLRRAAYREGRRCLMCYEMRLSRAAHIAKKGKFDYFTTTLLVSKYQKHDLIAEVGKAAGEIYGIPFLYYDFREGFSKGVEMSKEMGLYRQQYCGCIYSEMERYAPRNIWQEVYKSED
ncbi:hypothetical protein SAMN02745221_01411 [Thermosyntropha lipolytica DSM 11003]|uniref:Epoxyqueuosine reductase QueH n=1 Tax=Thermosyntropha lipolytica DSM 11003 TaxID=1123382 RepID=A0A1M5P9K1_9FIRM|nr:epoxyqueuosine reductase QueH [Thermosyntropha lipolytica]SHG98501.1 hypothetical protein SAMN02745221_01411 [Thermosyntropha lipolytica DSM 11003]